MPQIANQDYIVVNATSGIDDSISKDAHILAELKRHFLKGTIFDVIVLDNFSAYRRIIATDGNDFAVAEVDGIASISTENSVEQYEGLAAIQQAALNQGAEVNAIPTLFFGNLAGGKELGAEVKSEGGARGIVDEDGNAYSISIENNILTAVQKKQQAPEYGGWDGDPITVPFEEVQKLIGLPVEEH